MSRGLGELYQSFRRADKRRVLSQFYRFCVVGVTSTLIDWGVHRLLYAGFGGALRRSVHQAVISLFPFLNHPDFDGAFSLFKAVSFTLAVINGFLLNRLWTFEIRGGDQRTRQFFRFVTVTGIGMVLNVLVSSQIHKPGAGEMNYYLALIVGTAVVAPLNFAGHKLWTFRKGS
ncbi:MAG: GtrA family protein [Fimbriimonadales bacterium]|nr:GtrA family protein [Fimbriimonadales bacterium]